MTIADDDINPAVTLSVSPASVLEGASATSVTVTATAASAMTSARTVAVQVGGGTATAGTDYAAVSDFNITIAANATSGTGTFTLTPTQDTTVEGGETIGVSGSSTATTVTGTTVALTDDDGPAGGDPFDKHVERGRVGVRDIGDGDGHGRLLDFLRAHGHRVGGPDRHPRPRVRDYAAVTDFDITIAANGPSGTGRVHP